MIILIRFPIIKRIILFGMIIIICILGSYKFNNIEPSMTYLEFDEEELEKEIQEIFDVRNKAIISEVKLLKEMYDRETNSARWAYERVEKVSEYLRQWSEKQATN